MTQWVYVPALDSRPILDADSADQGILYGMGGDSGARYTIVINTLAQFARNAGKPGFNWLPYAIAAYQQNIMSWTAGGGNKVYYSGWISPTMVLNAIVGQAANADPIWQPYLYNAAEVQAETSDWQTNKQAASSGGGVLSQVFDGVKNIASVIALPAAVLALPALVGQPTIFQAIAANASGATTFTDVNAATGAEAYGQAAPQVATATPVSASADIASTALPDSTASSAGSIASDSAFTDANAATGSEAFGTSAASAGAEGAGTSLSTLSSAGSAIAKGVSAVGAAIGTIFGGKSSGLTPTGQPAQTNLMPFAVAGVILLAVVGTKKRGRK